MIDQKTARGRRKKIGRMTIVKHIDPSNNPPTRSPISAKNAIIVVLAELSLALRQNPLPLQLLDVGLQKIRDIAL